MNNRILKVILLLSIILVIIATVVSCCMPLENLVRAVNGEGAVSGTDDVEGDDLNGGNNDQRENISPLAIMEIYQQNSNGYYIEAGNPVYLTGENSSDTDGDMLEYQWEIGDGRPLNGKDQEHTFEELGKYTITLTVSDGKDQSQVKRQVEVIEAGQSIIIAAEHSLTVEIQYVFENTGPGEAEDLFCLIEVPQTQHPYQVVLDRRSNYQEGDRSFNDGFNIIARFNLGELAPGESKTAYINCDVVLYEYDFDDPDGTSSYKFGDSDLLDYTKDEYFIDSDSNIIKSAARSAAGQEKDPLVVAGRLYDFVAATLDYDYDIIKNEQFGFNYASQVLQNGKGVCTDYSVLYAALCRASGIPANIVQGIPVFSILNEPEKELSYGHAWVEIKLPGYGWIPVDVTSEENFMGYNYFLNLQTYKGSGIFHKSLKIEDENYYPTGFYYTWTGDSEPHIVQKVSYKVKGLNSSELSVIRESSFLDSINTVLSEYDAAINHINNAHGQSWTFNDPEDIAIEESFLQKLIKLSEDLENITGAGSFSSEHAELVQISKDIISDKNGQINCMKSGDHNCYKIKNIEFSDSLNELFRYFNEMVDSYNEKY
ncbi:MAG: PKD domain-containing protein [Actinobacteria bacterium]|nr:PKD domain-containing protein [Actinomycetota bacterium]